MPAQPNITELLVGYGRGDKEALDRLMPIVYDELRRQAARYLKREQEGHKPLTNFEDSLILSFDWMKDGTLVASRGVIMSDVVLIQDATK